MADAKREPNGRKLRLPLPVGAVALIVVSALLAGACGEKEEPDVAELPPAPVAPTTTPMTTTTSDSQQNGNDQGDDSTPGGRRERAAIAAVRDYVDAIDAGDGTRTCSSMVPGALQGMELPFRRDGCGPSLTRSIGHQDPRGLPVFAGAELRGIEVRLGRESARAVATVVTSFADRPEPTVEDDIVYLVPDRDRWLVAKPSALLYRAVGIADVPPSVMSPPR